MSANKPKPQEITEKPVPDEKMEKGAPNPSSLDDHKTADGKDIPKFGDQSSVRKNP